jgi:hypothetical protein
MVGMSEAVKRIAIRIGDHSSTDVVEMNAADLIVAMREIGRLTAQNAKLVAERDAAREHGVQARLREKAAEDKRIHDTDALRAQNAELVAALKQSVELQSHYAELLNMYDGGQRLTFASVEAWLDRLAALAAAGQPQGSGE